MSQAEFGAVAHGVMRHVFEIHNDIGRFFDEAVYQQAVAAEIPNARTEACIDVTFEDFRKEYFMDLLVDDGAVFEFKAAERLSRRHRAQLLNYLVLAELPHGKLINVRPALVEHEFVNTSLTRKDRTNFSVDADGWTEESSAGRRLKDWLLSFLDDMGTGLEIPLYVEAATHFLGGEELVLRSVDILRKGRPLGRQKVQMSSADAAFEITQINDDGELPYFEENLRRFLVHTKLNHLQWINITLRRVTFRTVFRQKV